ncbi:hypothetical protein FANTH_2824 [Fusarium anthophilum]|uniref:C2H2-type domain-containing protein n=1 Tax=Fusarium anthophilum TaxID=48485 RepID=A0A8H4ZT47_9HYPO|nr:hypothetical protein FANTH_2824 [Fusarium anthophilum]
MAANHQTSFERSLDLFRRELSDDQIKQMDGANQKSLNETIQATQSILGRRNDLCKLTRIQKFLHAMEHVEKLVSIFLNASDFVAFVWGPIKMALMVATTWTDAIRQLIDAYEEIAEALGNLAFFHTLIQSRDHLKLVLEDYFSDILRFHRCVLDVFSRPEWKRIFKWAWGSFRREVKPILESLKRKQALLSDDKLQSHAILKEVQDSDQYAKDQFSELQTSLEDIRSTLASEQLQSKILQAQEMKTYLESRLDVSKSRTDLQLESQDHTLENSGNWIFSDPTFKGWEGGKSAENKVLFLNGSPGSADRRTARSMLQHIIMQLANADETVMRLAYERLSTMESTELADLKRLASDCLTSRQVATLVLDGLDEAMDNEYEVSINWCLNELLPVAKACGCSLNVLICGQRDGRIDALLSSYPQIRLDNVHDHRHDIKQFTKRQAAGIRARFSLTQEEEEFDDELGADTFPETLEKAYDRIAHRVLKKHGPSRHNTVKKILGWVICAERPLRWREIQSRFCIDAEKETCNIRNLRRDSCKSICSSLIDVTNCEMFPNTESEQVISIVHETATKYLVRNGTVNLLQEHIDMALFCCRYLSSRPFTTSKSQDITTDIHSGYLGFLDYAAAYFTVHIQKVEASEVSADSAPKLDSVKAAAVDLEMAHCKEAAVEPEDNERVAQDLKLTIEDIVLAMRSLLDLQREKSETAVFESTEGPIRHKCHKIRCSKFATGFSNETALEQHLAVHNRPFRCPYTDCFGHAIGHASQKQLESHDKTFHRTTTEVKATFPSRSKTRAWDLYEACKAGDLDEVKRFHREGSDLNGPKGNHITPLCAAAEAGHGPVCKYLVDNGIDPFYYNFNYKSLRNPITGVINGSHLDILELFLQSGKGPNDFNLANSISRAIHGDSPAALRTIMTTRQPIDHAVVIQQVLDTITSHYEQLRTFRPDYHPQDVTLLHVWFQYVKPELYNEKGVFIAGSNNAEYKIWRDTIFGQFSDFGFAQRYGFYSFVIFLMDIGYDAFPQSEWGDRTPPLHSYIQGLCKGDCSGCMSIVRRLLQYDAGKFANITDSNGNLPAHKALSVGAPQAILRVVLENTRDINHRDNSGQSLLHVASSADSIRVLLENKSVDLSSRNNKGQTAFSAAIDQRFIVDVKILECLFKAYPRLAWAPDKSEEGLTPLHYALKRLERTDLDSYSQQVPARAAKFLLTCSEVEKVLVVYQAKSSDADRRTVRDFAGKEMLQEALSIMDSIGFNTI